MDVCAKGNLAMLLAVGPCTWNEASRRASRETQASKEVSVVVSAIFDGRAG